MSGKIRFGIVGCGLISSFHAKAITAIPYAELVACADLNMERAERLASQYGGIAVTDYVQLLEREDVDVICICTPNGAHE